MTQFILLGAGLTVVMAVGIVAATAMSKWAELAVLSPTPTAYFVTLLPTPQRDLTPTIYAQRLIAEATGSAQTATTLPTSTFTPTLTYTLTATFTPTNTLTATITPSPIDTSASMLWLTDTPFSPTETPLPSSPTPTPLAPPPIISRAEWGAELPSGNYMVQTPIRITLHHDGIYFDGNAKQRIRTIQRYAIHSHGWVDIPYHYLIDREGNIYEGRPALAVGDTATDYDPVGHVLITVLGDYTTQEVDARQIEAIITLATWLSASYNIPPQSIAGHRDYAATSCPGDYLYAYLSSDYIANAVIQRLLMFP
jgi:hypothetical protein